MGFPGGSHGKKICLKCRRHRRQEDTLGQEDSLEEEMATHSSILAWEIPWTEEPDGLQSMVLQSIGEDSVTKQPQHVIDKLEYQLFNQ